jgi:integrase
MTQEITNLHRANALAMADKGVEKEVRIRDSLVRGLCIRVRGKRAVWALMTRAQSIPIGDAEELSVKEARERARYILHEKRPAVRDAVATLIKVGINPIDAGLMARGIPIDPTDKFVDHWTWKKGMDAFLVHKLPSLSARWRKQVKKFARDNVFFPAEFRPLSKLDYAQLDLIRKDARATYSKTRAAQVISVGIQMLDYVWKEHRTEAGLTKLPGPWWTDLRVSRGASGSRHMPSMDDLVQSLAVLRADNSVCRRKLAALSFCISSAQRINQVCSTECEQIEWHEDGSATIHWRGTQMKNKKPQALWLPAEAMKHVQKDGIWAFPSDEQGRTRLSSSVVTRWLTEMWRPPARPKLNLTGKKRRGPPPGTGRKPSILRNALIEPWTPHGARTTCSTLLIDAELDGAASAILGHVPRNVTLPERPPETRAEAVTLRHYNRAQRVPLKRKGIEKWHAALREAEARLTAHRA